jgi:hypothetical protein
MWARRFPLSYYLTWPWRYLQGRKNLFLAATAVPPPKWSSGEYDLAVGFLGDLMGLGDKDLVISSEVKDFFADTSTLIFNLEGPLQAARVHLGLKTQATYSERPLRHLRETFPHHRLIAGLANNHIDDVSEAEFQQLLTLLNELKIEVLGLKSAPVLALAQELEVVGVTLWKSVEDTRALSVLPSSHSKRIVFAHFGDEFQSNPSNEQREFERKLGPNDVALVGHHTHFPQPIEFTGRYIAWSLGNFAVKFGGRPVNWGLAIKLGFSQQQDWCNTGLDHTLIRNRPEHHRVVVTKVNWPTTFE